ncbi:DUF4248 domain-containing protein [Phocaeicola sp.]
MEKKEEWDEEGFPIREYAKVELAVLYNPLMRTESAMKKLNRWIRGNTDLVADLEAIGWHPQRHCYLPREVKLIIKYIGTPG